MAGTWRVYEMCAVCVWTHFYAPVAIALALAVAVGIVIVIVIVIALHCSYNCLCAD